MGDQDGAEARDYRTWALGIATMAVSGAVGAYATADDTGPKAGMDAVIWLIVLVIAMGVVVALHLAVRLRGQDRKLDKVINAQQVAMRSDLMHRCEKYIERGWITPEEHMAISDMYGAYDSLGKNGFMKTYIERVDALERREL